MDSHLLKNTLLHFVKFSNDEWNAIENTLIEKVCKKGELYLKPGEVNKYMGFVVKGAFRKFYVKQGEEINFFFYFENEFVVAFQSFLEQKPTIYTIEAMENSKVILFPYSLAQKLYSTSKEWERFGRIICEKMYILSQKRIENFLFQSATERYDELIKEKPEIFQRIPLYHIASYLGMKPQTLSKIRKMK